MSPYQLMQKVEAFYERVQARQEEKDEAYCASCDEFEEEMSLDELLEKMLNLPDSAKQKALREAAQYQPSLVLAEMYEQLLQEKTGKALQEAQECARYLGFDEEG
jgi:PHD/YefM family antitoxin component YafN of YafNO toxin-antitoxin module